MSKPQRKPRHVCNVHRILVLRMCSNCGEKGSHFSYATLSFICNRLPSPDDCFYCPRAEAA